MSLLASAYQWSRLRPTIIVVLAEMRRFGIDVGVPVRCPVRRILKGVGNLMESHSRTKNRGFASMDTHRQREIARKGGRAAHEKGKAHEFTPDEARAAGRKGGEKVSVNRKHMAEIGRRGGRSSAARRRPDGQSEDTQSIQARPEDARLEESNHQPRDRREPTDDAPTAAVRDANDARTPAGENL